jgi:hypothetical protein
MRFLEFMNTPTGRGIRIVGGLALGAAGLAMGGTPGTALAVFAVLPIATGVVGVCPINPLFGQPMRACSVPAERNTPRRTPNA